MHGGVEYKEYYFKNDSYENSDTYSDICLDMFKELTGGIFSGHFILPNVADCQLKNHLHRFHGNLLFKTRVCWFEPSLLRSKLLFFTDPYCLGVSCSSIQFYLLLSPYLCFIVLLYLDLYVLGDDALISKGSFMQTKYLCVLIHI